MFEKDFRQADFEIWFEKEYSEQKYTDSEYRERLRRHLWICWQAACVFTKQQIEDVGVYHPPQDNGPWRPFTL